MRAIAREHGPARANTGEDDEARVDERERPETPGHDERARGGRGRERGERDEPQHVPEQEAALVAEEEPRGRKVEDEEGEHAAERDGGERREGRVQKEQRGERDGRGAAGEGVEAVDDVERVDKEEPDDDRDKPYRAVEVDRER